MRKSMFSKAMKILNSGGIQKEYEGESKIFFKVKSSSANTEDHSVILFYEDRTFKHSCTCMQMSKRDDPSRICSHKIAAFLYLAKEVD